jgi:hypothetical protein
MIETRFGTHDAMFTYLRLHLEARESKLALAVDRAANSQTDGGVNNKWQKKITT